MQDAFFEENINDRRNYIRILKNMTAEARLKKALEISEFTKKLFIRGLRKKYKNVSEEEFKKILLERLEKCHNLNY